MQVPVQIYDGFTYAIARAFPIEAAQFLTIQNVDCCLVGYREGANCHTLHLVHHYACILLAHSGRLTLTAQECHEALFDAHKARCAWEFPCVPRCCLNE
jgi:hypothetical protein